jgi:hypothetical protein
MGDGMEWGGDGVGSKLSAAVDVRTGGEWMRGL